MNFTPERFQTELDYATAMLLLREILAAGLIDAKDFTRAECRYAERCKPFFRQK